MPQSLAAIFVHIVFSTKSRVPYWKDLNLRRGLHCVLEHAAEEWGCKPVAIGGGADHVHVLIKLSREVCMAQIVKALKKASSEWAWDLGAEFQAFSWQRGYGSFSINFPELAITAEAIKQQEAVHSTCTFQDEFRSMMASRGIEWDEKFVWD